MVITGGRGQRRFTRYGKVEGGQVRLVDERSLQDDGWQHGAVSRSGTPSMSGLTRIARREFTDWATCRTEAYLSQSNMKSARFYGLVPCGGLVNRIAVFDE